MNAEQSYVGPSPLSEHDTKEGRDEGKRQRERDLSEELDAREREDEEPDEAADAEETDAADEGE